MGQARIIATYPWRANVAIETIARGNKARHTVATLAWDRALTSQAEL